MASSHRLCRGFVHILTTLFILIQIFHKSSGDDNALSICKYLRRGATCNITVNANSVTGVTQYTLTYGDSPKVETFNSVPSVFSKVYSTAGDYKVILKFGGTNVPDVSKEIVVKEVIHNATISMSSFLCSVGEKISFTSVINPNMTVSSHSKLGTGNWSSGEDIQCTTAGEHSLAIFIHNPVSAVLFKCLINVTVIQLNLTWSPLVGVTNKSMTFTPTNIPGLSFTLVFDTLSVNCTSGSVTHTFATKNEYPGHVVTLIASDGNGNSAKVNKNVFVMDPPTDLTVSATKFVGVNMVAEFKVSVKGTNISFSFDFGDGTTMYNTTQTSTTYRYQQKGKFTVTVHARNPVAAISSTASVVVVEGIEGLSCAEDIIATPLGEPTALGWVVYNGTEFAIKFQITTSLPTYVIHNITALDIFVLYKQHNYTAVGEYVTAVRAWNKVNNVTANCIVVVQVPISDVSFTVTYNGSILEMKAPLKIEVKAKGSRPLIEYDLGDSTKYNSSLFTATHQYQRYGCLNITITVRNNVSSVASWKLLCIPKPVIPLKTLFVQAKPTNFSVPTNFIMRIGEGSDFRCNISFGNSIELQYCYDHVFFKDNISVAVEPFKNLIFTENYTYPQEGHYIVNAFCFNRLSKISYTTIAIVQNPIQGFDCPQMPPQINGMKLKIHFTMTKGTNVTATLVINGVEGNSTFISNSGSYIIMAPSTDYNGTGHHQLFIHAKNIVSRESCTPYVLTIQEAITALTCKAWSLSPFEKHGLPSRCKNESNLFNVEFPMVLPANPNKGTNLTCFYNFDDGKTVNTTNRTVEHKYAIGHKAYKPTVTCYNLVSSVTCCFPVTMEKPVKSVTIKNNGPKKFKKTMSFTMNIGDYGTGTCFSFDWTDGTPIHVFGQSHCQKLTFPQGVEYTYVAEGTLVINTQHAFDKVDEYFVKINATNNVSCIATENQAVSVLKECHYPNVTMKDVSDNVTLAPCYYRSETKQFNNDVSVYCEVSQETNYTWKVTRIKNFYNETLNPPEVMVLPNVNLNNPILTLFQRSLLYGTYELEVIVYMSKTVGVRTIEKGYICISCTPYIVANIKDGKKLKRIRGDKISVSGLTSFDPDHEPGDYHNMTFYWFCRKMSEPPLSLVSPQSMPLKTVPSKGDDPSSLTNGGCFGTGAGRLPFDTPVIEINTALPGMKSGPENTFVLTLVVVKNDTCGIRVGHFDQYIELTDAAIPILSTVCSQNCLPKVNPNDKVAYQTGCRNCDIDTVYQWKVGKLISCDANPIDPQNMVIMADDKLTEIMYGTSKSFHMVVKENALQYGTCYTFILRATKKDGEFGEAAFTIKTNTCPLGGSMHVSPLNGSTLNTTYSVYFQNWDDTEIPLTYACGYKDGDDFKLLSRSTETVLQMGLPAGKQENNYRVTILCKVTDRSGCTKTLEKNVQVYPVNETGSQLLDSLNSTVNAENGPMQKAIQEGDVQMIFQLTGQVANALDDQYRQAQKDAGKNLSDFERQNLEETNKKRAGIRESLLVILDSVGIETLSEANAMAASLSIVSAGYNDLSDTSQEISLKTTDKIINQISRANPAFTSFVDVMDTVKSITGSLGSVAMAAADSAAFNSSSTMINITGITSNPNLTGMVSSADRAQQRVLTLMSTVAYVGKLTLNYMEAGETPRTVISKAMNTTVAKTPLADLKNTTIGDGLTSFDLPSFENMGLAMSDPTKDYASILTSSSLSCLYSWSNTSSLVKSQQVTIDMSDPSGKSLDTSSFEEDATIFIPMDSSKLPKIKEDFGRRYEEDDASISFMQIFTFELNSPAEANHLEIFPNNDTHTFQVFVQYGERALPKKDKFLYNFTLPDYSSCTINYENKSQTIVDGNTTYEVYKIEPNEQCKQDPYTIFLPYNLFNKTGTIYASVYYKEEKFTEITEPTPVRSKRAIPGVPCGANGHRMKRSCVIIPPPPPTPPTEPPWGSKVESGTRSPNLDFMGEPIDMNNTLRYKSRIYKTNCIYFDKNTNSWNTTGCKVGEETRKNRIQCKCNHFTSFGSDFFVAPNPIDFDKVFSADLSKNPVVLSVVCGLFGLYLILVVIVRRADKNDEKKIGVTPLPANTAPGSRSYLICIHTGVRYNAGTSANVYVVLSGEEGESPPVLLKDPEKALFTRGSDNSLVMTIPKNVGRISHVRLWHDNTGTSPSWYLSRIMIEDLHDHKKTYFVCERWLAVEEDDGRVDRIIPVASKKELTKFNQLFVGKTVQELGDGHLWFSIIARPPQSVFTRVQRLSVALSLLYCTMITSCMFYNTGGSEDKTYIFYLGSLKIDLKQLIIGLQSSLIVFPVNLAFMQIFRKVRPDDHKTEEGVEDFEDISTCSDQEERAEKMENKKKKKKKGLHPNWRYVAWVICGLSTCVSATFTVFYSLDWGPEKANKWMTAFVLSFFQSVLLIQPVKVVFAAIVFALVIKKPIEQEEEDQEKVSECMKNTETMKDKDSYLFSDGTRVGPPNELMLLAAREKRLKEIRMQTILREIIAYFIFMGILLLVAYGNRDPNAYLLRKSLYQQFASPSVGSKIPFESVGDVDTFWDWTRETLIPTLYPEPPYKAKKENYKGFLEDRHNYMVGISRLRQERIKADTCTVVPIFKYAFPTCYGGFSMSDADKGDYDVGWKYLNKTKDVAKRKRRSIQEQMWFVKDSDRLIEVEEQNKVLKRKRKRRAIDPLYVSTSGRQARKRPRGSSKTYVVIESAMLPDGTIMSCPTRWQYHNLLELRGFPYWGVLNFYGGGGFSADLGYDYSTALTVIADVNSHNWLDIKTRAIFVEFTVYNANTNLFGAAFLFMEFLPNGGAFPSASFVISRLYSYVGPFAKLILGMEIIMLLFMFYFMYREFKLMYKQGKAYFHGFWNLVEVVLIILEFIMLILFFARLWETDKNFIKLHHNPKDFVSFQYATAADQSLMYVIGLLVFLVTLRFLKLLRFNKKMAFIGTTIGFIAKPIALFMISFFVIFNAYGTVGVLLFGATTEAYKDFLSAAVTQMRILLGDFDYYEISDAQRILGPLYFFSYMYLIVFFLMNMFLAIINDSFSEVKDLENELSNEYEMVEFIMERLKSQLGFMKKDNEGHVKTPYGLGLAIPFWEYKRRKDSISSDSEFSSTTNFTALRAKRDMQLMKDDLNDVLKRLQEIEVEDAESDKVLMKVTQVCTGNNPDYDLVSISDNESECSTAIASDTESL